MYDGWKVRVQEYAVLDQFLHVSNLKFQANVYNLQQNPPHLNKIRHKKCVINIIFHRFFTLLR